MREILAEELEIGDVKVMLVYVLPMRIKDFEQERTRLDHARYFPNHKTVMMYSESHKAPWYWGEIQLVRWFQSQIRHIPKLRRYTFDKIP